MKREIRGRARNDMEDTVPPEQRQFRDALARWASGVAVIAARDGPNIHAITATAFAALSIDPPLVVCGVGHNATVLPSIESGDRFAINILGSTQRRLASMFADTGPLARDAFAQEGPPILDGALVALVCSLHGLHDGGDHALVSARVEEIVFGVEQEPLIRYLGEYRELNG